MKHQNFTDSIIIGIEKPRQMHRKCIINFEKNKKLPWCSGYSIVKDQTIISFESYGKCLAEKKNLYGCQIPQVQILHKFHLKSLK